MKMKILFLVLAILSILVGYFISFTCYMDYGLGLAGTGFGEVVLIAGIFLLVVCIADMIMSIVALRRGKVKKAIAFALVGVLYSAVILGGYLIDDAVHTKQLEKSIAQREEQMYGEGWDSPSAIEGIPELYQEVLNEYDAVVRDRWSADQLMDLGAVSMADYYGDMSLDNIGFGLMDLNGDNVDELLIGAVTSEGEGTVVFCVYSDPENPFYSINAVEGETYYLHSGQTDGTYMAEIVGRDAAWEIIPATAENTFDFNYREGLLEPADRLTLELTPFSQYK